MYKLYKKCVTVLNDLLQRASLVDKANKLSLTFTPKMKFLQNDSLITAT